MESFTEKLSLVAYTKCDYQARSIVHPDADSRAFDARAVWFMFAGIILIYLPFYPNDCVLCSKLLSIVLVVNLEEISVMIIIELVELL